MNGKFLSDKAIRTKEKEIQEIAKDICGLQKAKVVTCEKCPYYGNSCIHYDYAPQLYRAGYRKADKVRKETAEHILGALYDITFEREWDEVNGDHDEQKEVVSRAALINMAKDYGVELPE